MKTVTLDEAVNNPSKLINSLQFSCYHYNREQGMTAEQLVKLGFPTSFEAHYLQKEEASRYQGLFDLMSNEHGLTLTISEMDEIIRESQKISNGTT
jgi:hypothetical protein